MNYKKFVGKIVEVNVLDHEQETGIDPKDQEKEKPVSVLVYGKMVADCKEYIVVSSWVCDETVDVYRLLKTCINGVRVLK
jgi:hypothetical protein